MADNYFAKKRREREAQQGRVQLTPPDPKKPYEAPKAAADLEGQNLKNSLDALTIRLTKQEIADREAKAAMEAEERSAQEKAKEGNLAKIERTIRRLDEIARDAADNGGWFETGKSGAFARKRFGEGTAGYDLERKIAGVRGANFVEAIRELKAASKTGSTGAGGLTETEGKKLEDALAVLDPNMSHGEFLSQINQARETYLDSYRRLGGADPLVDPEAAPPAPNERLAPATGGTRTEVDEFRKGVMARVSQMVVEGKPRSQVEKFVRDNGLQPNAESMAELYKFRQSPDFIKWQRANPGAIFPLDPTHYTREVPLTGAAAAMNKVSQSAPGAYFANAANAISGGHLDDLGGEAVNTGLQTMQSQHPNASFLGDMSGQAMLALGASRLPGMSALGKFAPLAGDAAYGAYSGHGAGDTLGGIAANAAGGAVFRGAARGLGGAMRGVSNPNLQRLNSQGVPLTIGQIGRGSNSIVGNMAGGLEDRAAGFPIFDAIINTARRRGDEGFNAAAFREAGGTGATGAAGIADLSGKVDNAYSFLDSANLPLDARFAGAQAGVRANLPNLPAFGEQIGKSMDTLDRSAMGGSMPGRAWQSGIRTTKANRSSLRGQPFADEAVGALDDVETNLLDLAARQGPPNAAGQLADANSLNMRFQTLAEALDNGPTQARGELFSPTRLDTASRAAARKFGGRVNSMQGNRPFYDLTQAGMDVMPNLTPDSGTAGRAIFYSALPGLLGGTVGAGVGAATGGDAAEGAAAGTGYGSTLIPTLLLASMYSKGGQRGLQKALLGKRPKAAKTLGDFIRKYDGVAGVIGSALARDLFLHDELPE